MSNKCLCVCLSDVQSVAKSEDNFPDVIALADSLSMFSVI